LVDARRTSVFVEQLPHTATGKLLKTKLRQDFRDYKLPSSVRLRAHKLQAQEFTDPSNAEETHVEPVPSIRREFLKVSTTLGGGLALE